MTSPRPLLLLLLAVAPGFSRVLDVPQIAHPNEDTVAADSYIITAAHCLNTNVDRYRFQVGAHDRVTEIDGDPQYVYAREIILHPDWDNNGNNGFPNDIAIIRLNDIIPDSIYIQPIPLPEVGRNPDDWVGKECHISGWGRMTGGGSLPNILRFVDIPVISHQECQTRWIPYPVNDGHVCVFDEVLQDKGACNGDSGGPLVCRTRDSEEDWELVGLTSWGLSGCGTTYPSVYTRVSFFREWLDNPDPEPEPETPN